MLHEEIASNGNAATAAEPAAGVREFPRGFLWGAATAAFQVEGSTEVDGRAPSIWDVFSAQPGTVVNGETGEPGADHYRLWSEDIALMTRLGLNAYRFSISWPRILSSGTVNPAGLDFYERLVDGLLAVGIEPWPTLYHWDLPHELELRGGWSNRDTAYHFADYTEVVLARIGDRVSHWTTLNEPWCSAFLGYGKGVHAPGRREPHAAVAAGHHLLLAHGLALAEIRTASRDAHVGLTLNLFPVHPADATDPADVDAARRVDGLQNRFFLDPILRGEYADDVRADLAPYGLDGVIKPTDLQLVGAELDMLGVNYYRDHHVSGHPDGNSGSPSEWVGAEHVSFPSRALPRTDSGWEVCPPGLTDLLVRLRDEYPGIPLYVTENGAAFPDTPTSDGRIDDADRIDFLHSHLAAAHAAIEAGVDLRGYFCWSLLDNFEWAEGYGKRFGLVHVDYTTQLRTPKASAEWYTQVIRNNALT